MPNLIPDWLPWMRPAGRLLWSVALLVIGLVVVAVLLHRPRPDRPATWSECMAGAVGVFALMTLAYGVIPSEWITFSDKWLQWDTTKFLFRSHQGIPGTTLEFPIDFTMQNIRDIVVVLIYLVLFGLNLRLFVLWQKRGTASAPPSTEPVRTSRFGRPLRRSRPEQPVAATTGDA